MLTLIIFYTLFILVPLVLGLTVAYSGIRVVTSLNFGVAVVLGVFCLETWLVSLPAIRIGLNIYPQDLVFVGLAAVGGVRMLVGTNPRPAAFAWFFFGVMLVVSFVLGVVKYHTEAGVDLRPTFYFWATALYIGSFRIGMAEANRIMKMSLVVGVVVLLIVFYRWTSDALHLGSVVYNQIGAGKPLRVLTAGQAYFLAALTIMLAWSAATGRISKRASWLFLPFALTVLLLQHRSVWVATIIGLGVLYLGEPRLRGRFVRMSAIGGVVGTLLLIPLIAIGVMDPIFTALDESVQETMLSHGSTLTWRMESNHELFGQWVNGGVREYLIGKPFGSGYERFLSDLGHVTNYSPHNFYIQMLLRVGLIGLMAALAAYLYATRRLWVGRLQEATTGFAGYLPLAAVLVSSLVFFYPYGAHFVQGLFLGLALAMAPEAALARHEPERNMVSGVSHAGK
jgi:hypothetical protein